MDGPPVPQAAEPGQPNAAAIRAQINTAAIRTFTVSDETHPALTPLVPNLMD